MSIHRFDVYVGPLTMQPRRLPPAARAEWSLAITLLTDSLEDVRDELIAPIVAEMRMGTFSGRMLPSRIPVDITDPFPVLRDLMDEPELYRFVARAWKARLKSTPLVCGEGIIGQEQLDAMRVRRLTRMAIDGLLFDGDETFPPIPEIPLEWLGHDPIAQSHSHGQWEPWDDPPFKLPPNLIQLD